MTPQNTSLFSLMLTNIKIWLQSTFNTLEIVCSYKVLFLVSRALSLCLFTGP